MGLHLLLSSVDSSSRFSPPVSISAQIFQCYRATPDPHIRTRRSEHVVKVECRQQILFLSSFLACSHSHVPLCLSFNLAAHLSGSSAPAEAISGALRQAKNRPKPVEHIRSRGPLGDSRPSNPSRAWASLWINARYPFIAIEIRR